MNRFIKSFLFAIILFILFPKIILATILVTIPTFPQNNIAGQEFESTFTASSVTPNSNYYGKALGGENFTKVDTFNSGGWYQQNSAWANMPQFSSNSEGSVSGTIKAKFDTNINTGQQQFKIRIRRIDDDTNYDSEIVNIIVSIPTPTQTPSPTQKPSTPAPTSTPTPLRTSASMGQAKTKSPTPIETFTPAVLAESTAISDPTIAPTLSATLPDLNNPETKFPILAIIIIGLGVGMVEFAGYLGFKMRYNIKK